ncbi:MAG TPA: hypothetical protein VFW98_11425 [Gemmatimonadaceae bacterium]|nr:hypothetical protein [Gemmatimonadaceae bacterium]
MFAAPSGADATEGRLVLGVRKLILRGGSMGKPEVQDSGSDVADE